jgi:hypothetical protein
MSNIIPMNILNNLLPAVLFVTLSINLSFAQDADVDRFVSLAGKVTIKRDSDAWLKISVPFEVVSHPDLAALDGRKPSSREELFNPKFIEDLEIKLYLCFRNEFARKFTKTDKADPANFQYYSSALKCIILEQGNRYTANFLFPAGIAERDEFGGSYPEIIGYAVQFSRNGSPLEVSEAVKFDNYRQEEVLERFKSEAVSKSSQNDGILIPAHKVDQSFLRDLGPVYLDY